MTRTSKVLVIVVAALAAIVLVAPALAGGVMGPGMMWGYGGPHVGAIGWPYLATGWPWGLALGVRALAEQDLLNAHNAARTSAGAAALTMDPKLVTIARARAQDMATRSYFSHTSPGGDTAFSLLGQAGYTYTIAAENIARNNYPDAQCVSVAMDGFLNSPSHKENVMDGRFKNVGIGIAVAPDGMKYFAVVFAS